MLSLAQFPGQDAYTGEHNRTEMSSDRYLGVGGIVDFRRHVCLFGAGLGISGVYDDDSDCDRDCDWEREWEWNWDDGGDDGNGGDDGDGGDGGGDNGVHGADGADGAGSGLLCFSTDQTIGTSGKYMGLGQQAGDHSSVGVILPFAFADSVVTNLVVKVSQGNTARTGQAWLYHDGMTCLLYTSPSPRDVEESRMPSSA